MSMFSPEKIDVSRCCVQLGSVQREEKKPLKVQSAIMPNHLTLQEIQMPQNTKDSKGGKNQTVKDTAANGGKRSEKGTADSKPNSPVGSQNRGEKKTTP